MQKRRVWESLTLVLLAIVIVAGSSRSVFANTATSPNYQLSESEFSAGATPGVCSGSYCARVSIGNISGESANATSTASFGSITPDEPFLAVIVDPGISNLGVLDTEHTGSKTMVVRIRNYLSDGYVLRITGAPPTYSGHALATPSTPTAATPGTEQFGINAAANTTPSIGAGPVQVPSGDFSYGQVNSGYNTANLFKYASGDVVAHSNSESGQTDFTISMIVNIANNTPAGLYSGDYSAVVVPTF